MIPRINGRIVAGACLLGMFAVELSLGASALAADITWANAGTGSWTTEGNWSPSQLPTTADVVYINNAGTAQIVLGDVAVARQLYLGNLAGQSGQLDISGGTLTATGNHAWVGNSGTGEIAQTGGAISVGVQAVYLGGASGGEGKYNMTDGSLASSYLRVGYRGKGTFDHSGGTVTVAPASTNTLHDLIVGSSAGSSGTYNLSGSGELSARSEHIGGRASDTTGTGGTGVFNQSGGTNTITYDLFIGNRGGTGTYRLTAGTLTVGANIVDGTGTSNFYIDGLASAYTLNVGGGKITVDNFGVGQGSEGEFIHATGALAAKVEYIGYNSKGTFTQTGGTNTVTRGTGVDDNFYLGYSSTGDGTYTLSGGSLEAIRQYIGDSGKGTFTQTDGTNTVTSGTGVIYIGNSASGTGTYTLELGSLATNYLRVGYYGSGTFDHSGGTVDVAPTSTNTLHDLIVGSFAGSSGTYNLSGSGELSARSEHIGGRASDTSGTAGTGVFNQGGGTNTITYDLFVGNNGGKGDYNLIGGELKVTRLTSVGYSGTGTFTQSGGTHAIVGTETVEDGDLRIGEQTTGTGTYNLTGGELAIDDDLYVGLSGNGLFTQSGAPSSVSVGDNLSVAGNSGSTGEYRLAGGTLTVTRFTYVGYSGTGTFTQSGGTHTIVGTEIVEDGDLRIGDQTTGTGTYNLTGGTLITDDDLYVGLSGNGLFTQSGTSSVSVGDILSIAGNINSTGEYRLESGTLAANRLYVGQSGTGKFTQTGGTNTVTTGDGYLYLGVNASGVGTYNLESGELAANRLYVGNSGTGTFTQTGGTNTVTTGNGYLYLGTESTGVGVYNLENGTLAANRLYVGNSGTGTFTQTGGTNTVTGNGDFYLGYGSTGDGTYALGGGELAAKLEYVGYQGTGTFTQTGGTNTVTSGTGAIYLGGYGTLETPISGTGTYNLSDGSLKANYLRVGDYGAGEFNQTGGTVTLSKSNSAFDLVVGRYTDTVGTYNLSDGQLSARSEHIGGRGTDNDHTGGTGLFNQSGGTNTITYDLFIGNRDGTGAYEISGGTLDVGGTLFVGTTGTGHFKIDRDAATIETNGYSQNADSTLELLINGISPINVDGAISLAGSLELELLALPDIEDVFPILINDGNDLVSGIFSGKPEGFIFPVAGSYIDLVLTYQANLDGGPIGNDVALFAVPEPSAFLLAAMGFLLGLLARRRRAG